MKDFLRKLELPEFIKDSRLTAPVIIILSHLPFMELTFWPVIQLTLRLICLIG